MWQAGPHAAGIVRESDHKRAGGDIKGVTPVVRCYQAGMGRVGQGGLVCLCQSVLMGGERQIHGYKQFMDY